MLVLSRKPGEWIDLVLDDGREIHLMMVEVVGQKVRIGIDCPRSIQIYRREIKPASLPQTPAAAPGDTVSPG